MNVQKPNHYTNSNKAYIINFRLSVNHVITIWPFFTVINSNNKRLFFMITINRNQFACLPDTMSYITAQYCIRFQVLLVDKFVIKVQFSSN